MHRQLNLLSFGEEAEEEEQLLAANNAKIQSSHDVLDDPRLLKSDRDSQDMVSVHSGRHSKFVVDFILRIQVVSLCNSLSRTPRKVKEGKIFSPLCGKL